MTKGKKKKRERACECGEPTVKKKKGGQRRKTAERKERRLILTREREKREIEGEGEARNRGRERETTYSKMGSSLSYVRLSSSSRNFSYFSSRACVEDQGKPAVKHSQLEPKLQ